MRHDFDAEDYWVRRIDAPPDLAAVGHRSLGLEYNRHIYRRRKAALMGLVAALLERPHDARVLELGCGSGFYVDFWQQQGVKNLTGLDLSAPAILSLRSLYPDYQFLEVDVGSHFAELVGDAHFDIVTAFDLVYHVLADSAFSRMIESASAVLADGGYFVWTDRMLDKDYSLVAHVRYRSRSAVLEELRANNLELVRAVPLFVFLETPVFGIKPIDWILAGMYRTVGLGMRRFPVIGKALGHVIERFDEWLLRRMPDVPNQYMLVARKRDTQAE